MKLDKKGWSLGEMIILIIVLALFLGVAIYYIYSLYASFNIEPTLKYYTNLENKLAQNAQTYLDEYYEGDKHNLIITLDTLKEYNLDIELKDQENNTCTGYIATSPIMHAYISCPNYTTFGYEGNINAN